MNYERDPAAIYQQSFDIVRSEADLSRFPDDLRDIIVRIIHACGMPEIAEDIRYSEEFARSACDALCSGAPVLCDSVMTASGIMPKLQLSNCEIIAPDFGPSLSERAKHASTTRSAMVAESWRARLGGAVAVIGNAPTALFRLLEMLDEYAPKPAAVIGFPVGFVGATESKLELASGITQCGISDDPGTARRFGHGRGRRERAADPGRRSGKDCQSGLKPCTGWM